MNSALYQLFRDAAALYSTHFEPVFAPFAESLAAMCPAGVDSALDVGTGTGLLARYLRSRARSVYGIDSIPEMLTVANAHNMTCVLADMQRLPFVCDAFDLVAASFGLGATQPRPTFRAFYRVLQPGGTLLIQEWGPRDTLSEAVDAVFDRHTSEALAESLVEYAIPYFGWDDQLQDADDYQTLLSEVGFVNILATESTPVSLSLSPDQFYRFRAGWLPQQRILAANDAEKIRREILECLPTDNVQWSPAVFRVMAQKP